MFDDDSGVLKPFHTRRSDFSGTSKEKKMHTYYYCITKKVVHAKIGFYTNLSVGKDL